MACQISSGRTDPCNDSISGLSAVFFVPFIEDGWTIAANTVTAMNVAITAAYKYELRADANLFVSDGTSDDNTGVSIFKETLTLALKKQDAATHVQVELMQKGLHYVVTKSNAGDYQLIGSLRGGRCSASNISSGGALTDFSGYNLTFTADSQIAAPFLDSATVTAFLLVESATNINP